MVTRTKSSFAREKETGASARWEDRARVFRYNYFGDLVTRLVRSNDFPLQVELHPGSQCGFLRCSYCYSRKQVLCEGLMSIDDYSQLFDELVDNPPFIEISGIGSDPLSYPYFCALLKLIRRRGFSFGIHTKGVLLNRELIELLNSERSEGSYITIGVDSANAGTYNRLHGLAPNSNIYDEVRENIVGLYTEKVRRKSDAWVNRPPIIRVRFFVCTGFHWFGTGFLGSPVSLHKTHRVREAGTPQLHIHLNPRQHRKDAGKRKSKLAGHISSAKATPRLHFKPRIRPHKTKSGSSNNKRNKPKNT